MIKALNKEERHKSAVPQNVFSVIEFHVEKNPMYRKMKSVLIFLLHCPFQFLDVPIHADICLLHIVFAIRLLCYK